MSEEQKPREWTIQFILDYDSSYEYIDGPDTNGPTKVVEHSAFEKVCQERDALQDEVERLKVLPEILELRNRSGMTCSKCGEQYFTYTGAQREELLTECEQALEKITLATRRIGAVMTAGAMLTKLRSKNSKSE